MSPAIIDVSHVAKSYRKTEVLKDVNFQVFPGEIIALLGENGAGKSTLINIINYLITANRGQVTFFNGKASRQEIKEKTGIMLQNNILLRKLKVKEVIELARSYYPHPKTFDELVEIAQLQDLLDNEMTKLSGGQQRRLSFATALAGNPDILFLDEPTASMDAKSRSMVWQQVANLKEQGKTVIVTSHYLEELEDIASRILILQDGVIAFDGPIAELRRIQGQGSIEFNSPLSLDNFQHIQPVIRIDQQADYYQIITQEVNQVVKQLVPYLDQISNLSVQQTTLETLFSHFRKES